MWPIIPFEIQGLQVRLNKPEVSWPIPDIILDLEPLLKQVVQVIIQKQESGSRINLSVNVLREHQGLVSNSQALVTDLEEKAKTKKKLSNIDDEIISWTQ